jgi:acyl-CoA thioester hydrolase
MTDSQNNSASPHALIRVNYRMTDQMGMVYYGNYLEMFEIARVEWLRARGLHYREMESEGFLLTVTRAECDYRRPARYDDLLEVETRALDLTRARIAFAYRVLRRDGGELLAEGRTEHAFISREGRPRRLSGPWFDRLAAAAKTDGKT